MCEAISATTALVASMAMAAASTAVSMYGQHETSKAQERSQKQAAEYNAQVAANEQATQRQLAQNEIAKGISDKERQQRAAARSMGEMRANMGASGFEMDTGSMASLLEESATEHQYDSNIIDQNAAMSAWQHQVGAVSASNNQAFAEYQKANASSGRMGTYLGMGGTLLGGISQGLGQYASVKASEGKKKGQ